MTIITISECRPVCELIQMECCTSRLIVVMTRSIWLLNWSSNVKARLVLIVVEVASLLSMWVSWQTQSRPELSLMKANRLIIAPFQAEQKKKQRRLAVKDLAIWTRKLRLTCNSIPLRCKQWSVLVGVPRSLATVKIQIIIAVATRTLRKAITHDTRAGIYRSHPYRPLRKKKELHINRKVNKNNILRLTNRSVIAQTSLGLKVDQ